MNRSIVQKQLESKINQLRDFLLALNLNSELSPQETEQLQKLLSETQKVTGVYEYLQMQQQISPEINIHLKLMEEHSSSSTLDQMPAETPLINNKNHPEEKDTSDIKTISSSSDISEANSTHDSSDSTEENAEVPKSLQKMEISINDKFRILKDLFNQNQQEYSIAIDQFNGLGSIDDAATYLNRLCELYKWDREKPTFKIFLRIILKRFQ